MEKNKEEIIENIKGVLDKYVSPVVDQHGGEVKYVDFNFDTGALKLMMSGACSGCAGSTQTLTYGVENTMKHYVPEVKSIESEDDMNSQIDPYYTDDMWIDFNEEPTE
jgi:Fe-S cluster biogenesis protein NfuA